MSCRRLVIGILSAILMIGITGCGANESKEAVTIFAASSLTNALAEIESDYEKGNSSVEITLNLAGSKTLRNQIENGAGADLFLSANENHYMALDELDFFEAGGPLLRNSMVLIVSSKSRASIESLADLTESSKIVLAQKNVPAGEYAREVLWKYGSATDPTYVERVLSNMVSEESNVRQVLMKVAMGEADAALVYKTDVVDSVKDKVTVIAIPELYNVTGTYYIGLSKNASAASRGIYEYILGQSGDAVFEKHGFDPIK